MIKIILHLSLLSIFSLSAIPGDTIGMLADWGIACGVAEYSRHMYDALTEKNIKVIKYKHTISFDKLLNRLLADNVKLLNIQYDPGLFKNSENLSTFILKAQQNGIRIVCTVHEEPLLQSKKPYTKSDYCIFHKQPKFCSDTKFRIISLPVPVRLNENLNKQVLRKKYHFQNDDKILVTTGFIFIPKKLPEILTALLPFLKSDKKIKIQFLNAITPRAFKHCKGESDRLKKIIEENNLIGQVTFINRFLSEEELQERLFLSDVGFTWFQNKLHSISATQREFIVTNVPFVANVNSHFDIEKGLVKVEGTIENFAQSTTTLLQDQIKQKELKNELEELYVKNNFRNKINDYKEVFYECLHKTDIDATFITDIKKSVALANLALPIIDCLQDQLRINFVKKPGLFDLTGVSERTQKLLIKPFTYAGNVSIFFDILWTPKHCHVSYVPQSKIRYAYSMFESNKIIDEWVTILNNEFDGVIVPDAFVYETYKNSGVAIPIFIIPPLLDLQNYLEYPSHKRKRKKCKFGMIGSYAGGGHKNQVLLLEAFCREFGRDSQATLTIHCRSKAEQLHTIINKYNCKNVHLIEREISEIEYFNLMKSFDCYVLLSKGEGYSITPRQALSLAIPCILTDSGAQKTICDSGFVRTVRAHVVEEAYFPHLKKASGFYTNCTLEDAQEALRDVFDHYDYWLNQAAFGKAWVKEQTDPQVLKQKYLTLIKPKKITYGSENYVDIDEIITDSLQLYTKMQSIKNG